LLDITGADTTTLTSRSIQRRDRAVYDNLAAQSLVSVAWCLEQTILWWIGWLIGRASLGLCIHHISALTHYDVSSSKTSHATASVVRWCWFSVVCFVFRIIQPRRHILYEQWFGTVVVHKFHFVNANDN